MARRKRSNAKQHARRNFTSIARLKNAQTTRLRRQGAVKKSKSSLTHAAMSAGRGQARTFGGRTRVAVAEGRRLSKTYGLKSARRSSAGLERGPVKTRAQSVRSAKVASGGRRKGRSVTARSIGSAFNKLHPRATNGRFRKK